jgi:hypothetical protein
MKLKFELCVVCSNSTAARNLASVLQPDNRGVPKDQRFSMERKVHSLFFLVESERIMSALSSIEGVLSDVRLFREVWTVYD